MLPLIPIALSLVPELIRLIAGDKAGTVAADVAGAVQAATGTGDVAEAQRLVAADPKLAGDLRTKLAQIALDTQKASDAAAEQLRANELETLRQAIGNTQNARQSMQELVKSGSPIAWGAPVVSVIVAGGFFMILMVLLWGRDAAHPFDPTVTSIVNLTIGALAASFATVVNFWLGSSQGSRDKDVIMRDLRTAQLQTPAPIATPFTTIPAAGDNYDKCLAVVLDKEGGYSNDPQDSGGPTQMGITLATLAEWRDVPPASLTAEDVRMLSRREAAEIYRARYWLPMRCQDLPAGIDLMVFDFGVNAGPRASVKLLQRAAGVIDDGSVGPHTLAAVKAATGLIDTLAESRLAYYRGLSNFAAFGTGWTNRTHQVATLAHAMTG
jgi:hypothetical protein